MIEDIKNLMKTDEGLASLAMLYDSASQFDTYEVAWWDSDEVLIKVHRSIPRRFIRLAVPVIWKEAPAELFDFYFRSIISKKGGANRFFIPKECRSWLTSYFFIKGLQRLCPPGEDAAPKGSEYHRILKATLSQFTSSSWLVRLKYLSVRWRDVSTDPLLSPCTTTNPYARVIYLDPMFKGAPEHVVAYALFHEMCIIISWSLGYGTIKTERYARLMTLFPQDALVAAQEWLHARNWSFEWEDEDYVVEIERKRREAYEARLHSDVCTGEDAPPEGTACPAAVWLEFGQSLLDDPTGGR